MLKLNTYEPKSLSFEVNIQGIDHKELQGSIRFIVNEVEYGFPVTILGDAINAKVPPLSDIISGIEDGDVIDCKLDIFGNGFYLQPWTESFKIQKPVKVDVKIKEEKQQLTVTLKDEISESEDEIEEVTDVGEHSVLFEDEEVKEMITKILDKKTVLSKTKKNPVKKAVSEIISSSPMEQVQAKKKKKLVEVISADGTKYMVSEKVAKRINEVSGVLKPKSSLSKPSAPKKRERIIVNDDPRKLMESVGMKSKKMQNIMLEKAEGMAGDDPVAQCEALKQILRIDVGKTQMNEMEQLHKAVMKNTNRGT